jgi:hypothetical protein
MPLKWSHRQIQLGHVRLQSLLNGLAVYTLPFPSMAAKSINDSLRFG